MSMLRDADLSLANWLKQFLPPGTGVRFDPPRADWEKRGSESRSGSSSESGSAFINAFLCTIRRDDQDMRRSGWSDARDHDGRLVGIQLAPRYYRLTYMITAWAATTGGDGDGDGDKASRRTLDEHDVLGLLIEACTNTDIIPADQLTGSLAEAGIPTFVRCAGGDTWRDTQGPWADFRITPHAHLELELVAPVIPPVVTELAPPAREIVVGASQKSTPAPTGDAAGSLGPASTVRPVREAGPAASAGPSGTVRRWERGTVVERAEQT